MVGYVGTVIVLTDWKNIIALLFTQAIMYSYFRIRCVLYFIMILDF